MVQIELKQFFINKFIKRRSYKEIGSSGYLHICGTGLLYHVLDLNSAHQFSLITAVNRNLIININQMYV